MSNLIIWTKNDMARVIIQALTNLEEPAEANHPEVVQMVKSHKKDRLTEMLDQAIETISRNRMAARDS